MKYFRVYTDSDGDTHFEDVEVEMHQKPIGSDFSTLLPATGLIFHRSPADQVLDWHCAPRRQFVVTLSGEVEVEASDGEIRHVGPGTVMLAEDVTGKGHITRAIGTAERLFLAIPVPE